MAKILVADDNSNVQKTVALALADLGVEVVAVNNGDAAVKRLADVAPDLVLADIFMPVRNGYEVCDYVKKDSRFSRIPVVLLVGAFDPLDEREAQRVGADGILKKPFVPPDPLIAMIKTLLDRTQGERLVAVGAAKPAASMEGTAGGIAVAEGHPSAPQTVEEFPEPEQEIHSPVDRVSFGEGDRPIAFGQLLDPPAQNSAAVEPEVIEPVDDAQILTSARDAALGEPAFWKADEPEPEAQDEDSEHEADEPAGAPMLAWNLDDGATPNRAESDAAAPPEHFELVRDEDQANATPTMVASSASILQDAASQAPLTVEASRAPDLAANPIEWMATVPPPPTEEVPEAAPEWSVAATETPENEEVAAEAAGISQSAHGFEASDVVPAAVAPVSVPAPQPPISAVPAQVNASSAKQSVEDTARSIPVQEWADLAASLQPKLTEPTPEKAKPEAGAQPSALPVPPAQPAAASSAPPASKPSSQSTEDTARSVPKQAWADLAASLQPKSSDATTETPKSAPIGAQPAASPAAPTTVAGAANGQAASPGSTASAVPDPALVEAVVQRVLEKMRPQVVDIITKEFLRPVVQALVHREITKR